VQINSVGGRGNIPAPFPGDLERDLESSVDSQGDAVSNDNFVLLHLQGRSILYLQDSGVSCSVMVFSS
jgi:hypothetical protein